VKRDDLSVALCGEKTIRRGNNATRWIYEDGGWMYTVAYQEVKNEIPVKGLSGFGEFSARPRIHPVKGAKWVYK
jgi:hypothetical protein